MTKPTTAQIARIFNCTEQQVRDLFAKNAQQLAGMADEAERTERKVNGYTAKQLRDHAAATAARA
jgi:hypothetical protein